MVTRGSQVNAGKAIDAVIVGAGPAGLATARQLARRGVDHLVLERGDQIGHTWRNLYESLVLHTGKHLSSLPGLPFPASTSLFPSRQDVVDYLDRYAAAFHLSVRTSTEVTAVHRAGGHWSVHTRDGASITARAVVIATGIAANPHTPDVPGRDLFSGRIRHSVEYRHAANVSGPRVLVVGAGNSGADISTELAHAGRTVTVSVRSIPEVAPLRLFGLPAQYAAVPLCAAPQPVRRAISGLVSRPLDMPRAQVPSRVGGSVCARVPIVGDRFSTALARGTISIAAPVAGFTRDGVRFADGAEHAFDDVIFATGYRAALACLGGRLRVDGCGSAFRRRRVASADAPDLYFVGDNADLLGTLHSLRRDARRAAQLIARAG
jgi:pyruvate/2-oxoglutarate dehydrogenase complex dihydrolipoamide dehydrogenase (E3) component